MNWIVHLKLVAVLILLQHIECHKAVNGATLLVKRVHGVVAEKKERQDVLQEDTIPVSYLFDLPGQFQYKNISCKDNSLECHILKDFNSLSLGIHQLEEQQIHGKVRKRRNVMHTKNATKLSGHRRKRQLLALVGLAGAGYIGYKVFRHQQEIDQTLRTLRVSDQQLRSHVKGLELAEHNSQIRIARVEKDLRMFSKHETEVDSLIFKNMKAADENILALYKLLLRTIDYLRFRNIIGSCRMGLLPEELVTRKHLLETLEKLIIQLSNNTMTPALTEDNVNSIYSKPLVSCLFGETQMLVTLRFPLVRKDVQINLFKITSIPFLNEKQICKIHTNTRFAVELSDNVYPVSDSDCNLENGVCKIGEGAPAFSSGECVATLLQSGSLGDLKSACSFTCYNVVNKVIVTRVGPLIYLTNVENLTIACLKSTYTYTNLRKLGSIEVILTPGCVAKADNELIFPKFEGNNKYQFEKDHTVYMTIPGGWAKGFDAVSSDAALYKNINELYNPLWYKSLNVNNNSYSNISDFSLPSWRDVSVNSLWNFVTNTELTDILYCIWMSIITILVCLLYIFMVKKWCKCCKRKLSYRRARAQEMEML